MSKKIWPPVKFCALFSTFTFLSHFIFSALLLSLSGEVWRKITRCAQKKANESFAGESFWTLIKRRGKQVRQKESIKFCRCVCVGKSFIIKFIYTSRTILNKVRGRSWRASVCALLFINTQQQQQYRSSNSSIGGSRTHNTQLAAWHALSALKKGKKTKLFDYCVINRGAF